MTESEVLDLLKRQGIIREDGENLRITDLSDITFIHQDTGKKYKFFINESGDLINQEIPNDEDLISNRVIASGVDLDSWSARGFIGRLRLAEYNKANPSNRLSETQNIGLYSDRIKLVHSTHRWIQISYTVVQERSLNLRIHLIATFAYRGAICITLDQQTIGRLYIIYHLLAR